MTGQRAVVADADAGQGVTSVSQDTHRPAEFQGMIGSGPAMQALIDMIRRLAPHGRTALITGETGTGKDLVARALHELGPRRDRRFVTVTCSAAIDAMFEGGLFGHAGGSADAPGSTPGLFELADGGTLFFDEIGELPLALQAKLLRVVELGDVQRIGALEPRHVDLQILASTNRDLRADVAAGRFRGDLYYRLNVVEIKVPALRDRREDIPCLTAAFVRRSSERLSKPVIGLTSGAERVLWAAPWDGNVRELRNVIERACLLADGEFLTEREVATSLPGVRPVGVEASDADGSSYGDPDLLTTVERDHIQRALARANGNKKAAARMLGLSRRALYRRLERLDLSATITRRVTAVTDSGLNL